MDDRFFDKPYYVTPGAGGDRAYVLLRETIRDAGKIGIAKFVLRDRQHLAAIEVIEDALVLSTLRFADELVPASEYSFPSGKGQRAADLKVAKMLVNELSAEWSPEKYTDDYRTESGAHHRGPQEGERGHARSRKKPSAAATSSI